jgi:hypothetical protein
MKSYFLAAMDSSAVNTKYIHYIDPLSLWHGASSGCRWRRRPPERENSFEYVKQATGLKFYVPEHCCLAYRESIGSCNG